VEIAEAVLKPSPVDRDFEILYTEPEQLFVREGDPGKIPTQHGVL
jgi:hypothetical protein